MDKFSELKAAAMAATPRQWVAELTEVWVVSDGTADFMLTNIFGDNELSAEQDRANAAFIAAANPPAVLDLLAELEREQEMHAQNLEIKTLLAEKIKTLETKLWDSQQLVDAKSHSQNELLSQIRDLEERYGKDMRDRGKRICELDDSLEAANKRIADDEEYIEKLESAWERINELEINEKQMLRDHYCAEDVLARQRNDYESALDSMYEAVTGKSPAWGCGFGADEAVKEVAQIHAELEARLTTPVRLPAAKDPSQGWTIDPDYLSAIAEKVGQAEDGGSPSMETVEAVLLATGFTVGNEAANDASVEGELVTAMGYQGGTRS
ncbi:hypothetical protein IBZ12_21455 [Serratia ureilytica]|uniref:hypothetical protein n=1 Tax=Serratia ureilytica TaxID=300181 RepID=UPI0039B618B0